MKSMTSHPSLYDRDCRNHARRYSGGIGDKHRSSLDHIRTNDSSDHDLHVRRDYPFPLDFHRSAPTPTPTPTPRWQPPKQNRPQNAHVRSSGFSESTVGSSSGTHPLAVGSFVTDKNDGRYHHHGNYGNGKTNRRQENHHQSRRPGKPYERPSKPLVISPDIMQTETKNHTHTPSCSSTTENNASTQETSLTTDPPKLDPANPTHARRIHQRRRQVLYGKNTAGYEEYIKQVPKDQRKKRNMDHPSTPDHTLDVPTRRWQGIINAWRRALHKFDPPDLTTRQNSTNNGDITLAPRTLFSEQDKIQEEITKAKAAGLQVAFGSMSVGGIGGTADLFKPDVAEGMDEIRAEKGGGAGKNIADEALAFDEEEAYRRTIGNNNDMEECSDGPGDMYDDTGANACIVLNGEDKPNQRAAMVAKENSLSSIGDGGFLDEGCDCDSDDDLL